MTSLLRVSPGPPDRRKAIGERVNSVKQSVESAFEARLGALAELARRADLAAQAYDLTLPGRVPVPRGHLHPLSQVREEILDVFRSLGFEIADGPEIEIEETTSRDRISAGSSGHRMQDTFWVRASGAPQTPASCSERTRATCKCGK